MVIFPGVCAVKGDKEFMCMPLACRWDMQIDVASDSAAKSEHKRVLKVNFDPALIALLREVQGMRTASALPMQIPAAALMIAERGEFFRVQVVSVLALSLNCQIHHLLVTPYACLPYSLCADG